jgi:hypothetical protein
VLAGLVLTALFEAESGATAGDLARNLRDHLAAPDDDADLLSAVESALSEFERLGLVQPDPS